MKKLLLNSFVLFALLWISSCTKEDPAPTVDYNDILGNIGENVILKTYEDLATKAVNLQNAAKILAETPSETNLMASKNAWVAAREPWEEAEGFLFGPVEQEGLDPALDSWPVNVIDLSNVLNSGNAITADFLAQQEGTLKGFHTIEFLLWGENGNKTVAQISTREFEYLVAACEILAQDAQELYNLWNHSGGNYIDEVINAGNGSKVYISQKSALEEITNGLIIIADEVANGKINDPLAQQDLSLEESRFSANSKADFANNIRSIQNIYTGTFGNYGNGKSISTIIQEKNEALNEQVLLEISASIEAIETIPGTFSTAIFAHSDKVSLAQTAVRNLQMTLEEQVLPIISNL
ncbi:MAG: imelysin [Bacteroidetes bacterium]|nr:imelysin [Bacteroidota bacterium]